MLFTAKTFTANGSMAMNLPHDLIVGRAIVDYKLTGGTFTLRPQKRMKAPSGTAAHTFADCWYTTALDNTARTASTDQTANGIIDVDLSGCEGNLVITIGGGGSLEVFVTIIAG